jgi:flagellar protein FliO/FliZ
MLELAIRLVFSLAIVLGLLLLIARFSARRFRGGKDALVQVVHRQHLSRGAAVSVVTVGSKVLVLGTTEHQVRVLTELDPEDVVDYLEPDLTDAEVLHLTGEDVSAEDTEDTEDTASPAAAQPAARSVLRPTAGANGPLTGSVLSPATWRQALAVATGRAS